MYVHSTVNIKAVLIYTVQYLRKLRKECCDILIMMIVNLYSIIRRIYLKIKMFLNQFKLLLLIIEFKINSFSRPHNHLRGGANAETILDSTASRFF